MLHPIDGLYHIYCYKRYKILKKILTHTNVWFVFKIHTKVTHFRTNPAVFLGGGSLLLKQQIEKSLEFKYIEFIDHDLDIDFNAEMSRIQKEMKEVLAHEKQSQKMLEDAFRGIGYGID